MAIEFKKKTQKKTLGTLLGFAGGIAATMAATAVLAPGASAQETVLDAVEDISTRRSGDYYDQRSVVGQIGFISGLGGYPEQRFNREGAAISKTYRELMLLQNQSTEAIRVPDLPNPYNSSVQLLPTSQFNSRVIGSELNFEPLPRR